MFPFDSLYDLGLQEFGPLIDNPGWKPVIPPGDTEYREKLFNPDTGEYKEKTSSTFNRSVMLGLVIVVDFLLLLRR